jgi:pyruvoyl-dependent arginine decarboxylase (PvlArgDC)
MAGKTRNLMAQALGLVLQGFRDKMGGISSSDIASQLGLAASHYRMIEAGSAILQPSRAMKDVQTFDTIEFIPLCQVLVSIQILDTVKESNQDTQTTAAILAEANPTMAGILSKLSELADIVEEKNAGQAARLIVSSGLKDQLGSFLTTEPVTFTAEQIDNFMSPTYEHPLSGRLYGKIGNILQGVAPFYLDTVLQLIDNLRNVTPRVTAEELARWESLHNTRISHLIGIVRRPEIILDIGTFDYSYLWEENFQKILIIYRDEPAEPTVTIRRRICDNLRRKFQSARIKYERQLQNFDTILNEKLQIEHGRGRADDIDEILLYRQIPMNNLWAYIMVNGYVVPFIDNATVDSAAKDLYGTSLGYDETSEKLIKIRKLCSDLGLKL